MAMSATSGSAGSMYLQAAGMGFSAVSAYKEAQSQKAVLRYQAKVAANNAQIAEFQAQQEEYAGAIGEQASRLRTAGVVGSQRAAMAANGIDLGEGNASDILATSKFMGERDALTIRDNAARAAWGARVQKQNYLDESSYDNANAAAINPTLASVGSLLGNSSTVASMWKTYKGS